MRLGEDLSSRSKNEIVLVKKGSEPEKVIDEGDSLGIGAEVHSFYWRSDVYKEHDYEPIAVSKADNCCLTRFHNNGIVVWKDFFQKEGKPVAYFRKGFHTPVLCTTQKPTWLEPSDILARMLLNGYFIPKIKKTRSDAHDKYDVISYFDKITNEDVPNNSRFTWDRITYYVVVAPTDNLEELDVSPLLKAKLMTIRDFQAS